MYVGKELLIPPFRLLIMEYADAHARGVVNRALRYAIE